MSSPAEQSIVRTLLAYGDGLNTASVSQCVSQYAHDGICMPQHQPSSQGTEALTRTYEGFFNLLKFDVKFDIKEVNVVNDEWAFARTTSAGTTIMGGQEQHEANQELFVMKHVGSEWKIARYCFCTTNPPK
jgi:ketosteroid isomerase-like protein